MLTCAGERARATVKKIEQKLAFDAHALRMLTRRKKSEITYGLFIGQCFGKIITCLQNRFRLRILIGLEPEFEGAEFVDAKKCASTIWPTREGLLKARLLYL